MAVKTVSNTGGNWASASTWSPSGVPSTTADNVVFTTTSGPLVISATATIENIDFRNFQNTVTFNWPLQVTGAFNFGTQSYTMSFSSTLDASARPRGRVRYTDTATITTNNRPWQTPWQFYGSAAETITLSGNLILEEDLYLSQTSTFTITGGSIITRKSVIADGAAGILTGGATFSMAPTVVGTWSAPGGGSIRNNLVLGPESPSGYLYISGDVYYGTRTITDSGFSSNVITTNSKLHVDASFTSNSSVAWDEVLIDTASTTLRLDNDLIINGTMSVVATGFSLTASSFAGTGGGYYSGNLSFSTNADLVLNGSAAAITFTQLYNTNDNVFNPGLYPRDLWVGGSGFAVTVNRGRIYVRRNLIFGQPPVDTALAYTGTTEYVMFGTQSGGLSALYQIPLSFGGPTYPTVRNNITINKSSGTLFLGELVYQTGTITYTSGNLVNGLTGSQVGVPSLGYRRQRLVINNSAAVVNVQNHNWDITQLGHRYFEPTNINRTLTYDWITDELWFGPVPYVELSGTYSMYVRTKLVGGDYEIYDSTRMILTGSASIILGSKGSTSSSDIEIGSKHPSVENTMVNNPIILNTTGKLKLYRNYVSLNEGGYFEYGCRNFLIQPTGNFRVLNGTSNFHLLDEFVLKSPWTTPQGNSSINFIPNSLTFSTLTISATGNGFAGDLDIYLGSSLTASVINFEPNETRQLISGIGDVLYSNHINIMATGSTIYGDTINFRTPGVTLLTDNSITNEALNCRVARFTAPVYLYNTIDNISTSEVGAASDYIRHPNINIVNGTFSVETDCHVGFSTSRVYISGNSSIFWKQNSLGLHQGTLFLGNTTSTSNITFKGDSRLAGSYNFSNYNNGGGTITFGTSSQYIYEFITFTNTDQNIRFNNVYFVGPLYSNAIALNTLQPLFGTVSINNFYLQPREFTKALNIGYSTVVNSEFVIGTLSFGQYSNFTLGIIKYRNVANTTDYKTDVYINNYFGSGNSTANYFAPITVSSTWSGNTPSNTTSNLIVSYDVVQDLQYVNALRINSSSGATVWTYKGTISSSTTNWNQIPTQPRTIFTSFSS